MSHSGADAGDERVTEEAQGDAGPTSETTSGAGPTSEPAVSGNGDPVATSDDGEPSEGGKSKVTAVAAGTGAAVAGLAGGVAVAARDTRRRVLGVPVGKRNRFQRGASAVVDKVQQPVKKLGARFSRD